MNSDKTLPIALHRPAILLRLFNILLVFVTAFIGVLFIHNSTQKEKSQPLSTVNTEKEC